MRRLVFAFLFFFFVLVAAGPARAQTIITYTSPLPVGSGGTGVVSFTANGVVYGNGTGALLVTPAGPTNSVLTASGGAPSFSATPQVTALGLGRAAPASGVSIVSTGTFDWNGDTTLVRDAAAILAMSSSLSVFRVYNNGQGTATYDRAVIDFSGGALVIGHEAGAASAVDLIWRTNTTNRWKVIGAAPGTLQPITDNGPDLGAVANRVRTGYFGTSIRGGAAGVLDLGIASEGLKRVYVDFTNTATVGAVTINKASGRVNIVAGGTSVVVTDSLVTAASHVDCWMSSADATGRVTSCVAAAGSFTINTVATTGQTSFDFQVFNAD